MSHKKKGQLTGYGEWHKHLRKIGKRLFWKKERKTQKQQTQKDISSE
jgi:hypothetical protein